MRKIADYFGENVFNESVMQSRLPKNVFKQVKAAITSGKRLDSTAAEVVAAAMKDWAIEKGATHYTHWFQPMTGITAEKHDSFITPAKSGKVIMEFSGKELIRGESDASSFPSGGLRATFEARGYTAWDPTSFAFIKDGVLYIPTAFCSYGGEALDKKTPLLRSMEVLNKQALRVVKLFGNKNVNSIRTTVGPEQEYFLIDKELFEKRKDLIFTGRTLFGAMPPKGQELSDHYFGVIKPRVQEFMKQLNEELWKLGVLAKTEHNEAAPSQHELAPIYATTNIAADHNQITMELMQKIAKKHGMICLLHEKPFAGVNGSGKHNNWSLCTDTGINLFEPGATPAENAQFLLFLCAVIKAVDDYQGLLRCSVTSAANDHRLGADEAPPAIMSIFLGDELTEILECIEQDKPYGAKEKETLKVGVHVLPKLPKDTTDRNRTSPFAFTGNKFEFRMLGSSASISETNVVLNTAVAEVLSGFADELEKAENFETQLHTIIKRVITENKRIIFNGNGYGDEWYAEAEKRGLLNLKSTPDCLPCMLEDKSVLLFTKNKIYTEAEIKSRYEIMTDNYSKMMHIEALTMVDMAKQEILPAVSDFSRKLANAALTKNAAAEGIDCTYEKETLAKIADGMKAAYTALGLLEESLHKADLIVDSTRLARFYRDTVYEDMNALRSAVDMLETVTESKAWPYPSYAELLFKVD